MNEVSNREDNLSHSDKTLRGLRHIGAAQLLTQLVTWAFTAVTIHLLQPRDYGLVATSGIVTALAQLLMDGGLTEVLIAQQELSSAVQRAATSAVLLVAAFLSIVVILIAPSVSVFFRSPPLLRILEVSAFYFPLSALEVVPKALLSKSMRFKRIALAQTIGSIIQGATTLGMAYSGDGYWALIFGTFIGTGIRISLLWMSLQQKPMPGVSLRVLRPLMRNSGHMIGMRLIWYLIDNFDLFILSRIGGAAALGAYSVARTLSYSAMNQVGSIVNQVALPAFAEKTTRDAQLQGLVFVTSLGSVILFPLFWIMGAVSPIALPLVFGARWNALIVPFIAFTIILPLRSINAALYAAVLGTGRTGTILSITVSWAAIIVPLMLVGVIKGADGVALSWTLGFPLVFYVVVRRISRDFSVPTTTFLRPILRPAACALASVLVSVAVSMYLGSIAGVYVWHLVRVVLVAFQCLVASACYWILLKVFGREQHTATLSIIKRVIRV